MSVFSSILSTPATLLVREFNHTNMHSALHTVGSTSPQSTRGERKETRVYQALLFFILKPRARATIKGKKKHNKNPEYNDKPRARHRPPSPRSRSTHPSSRRNQRRAARRRLKAGAKHIQRLQHRSGQGAGRSTCSERNRTFAARRHRRCSSRRRGRTLASHCTPIEASRCAGSSMRLVSPEQQRPLSSAARGAGEAANARNGTSGSAARTHPSSPRLGFFGRKRDHYHHHASAEVALPRAAWCSSGPTV